MDHERLITLRRGVDDEGPRASLRPASRSAENEARIIAHLRSALLNCDRSRVWT